jgi:cystathionine beta-lyase
MTYDFNEPINRKGTNSVKWEFRMELEGTPRLVYTDEAFSEDRLIPMWVADMDFRCPDAVVEALVDRAKHGIFGYTRPTGEYFNAVMNWMSRRYGWQIQPDWISITPGVVSAIYSMVQTFTDPGDAILIQPPVYYPFSMAIQHNDRVVVTNPLILEDGRYHMDFADLARKIHENAVKMAILCSPHNPVGRVWEREELRQFGEICQAHDVLVIADELHGDLIYPGYSFTAYATLGPTFEAGSVTCTSPSKTFNLAGLHTSNIIIPNRKLRRRFSLTQRRNGHLGESLFGMVALQAAYNHGEEWLKDVMAYIESNFELLDRFLAEIPEIEVIRPEGTYLIWLDCRKLGMEPKELERLMLDEARVYLDEGYIFGPEGEGFERINIACPRDLLEEALGRIGDVVENQRIYNS